MIDRASMAVALHHADIMSSESFANCRDWLCKLHLMDIHDRLKWAREKRGFESAADAARYLNIPYGTYSGHESGGRGVPRDRLLTYARAFKVAAAWLLTGEGETRDSEASIMGYIGAGAEILPEFDQVPPEGLFSVELPFPVPDDMIGFEVRGDSMLPRYDEGDVIIVYREQKRPLDSFWGEEAAVRTEDGRRFLKRIERGPDPRTVNLASFNAKTIESVRLDWIGEIWVTLRSGQLRRIEQKERAAALQRNRRAKALAAGTGDLPFKEAQRQVG